MLEGRKVEIDHLVSSLRTSYDASTFSGLRQIAEDRGIQVIETSKVIIECVLKREGVDYIFIGQSPFQHVRRCGLAHELGHALIDQTDIRFTIRELEANYFAESLVGPYPLAQMLATSYFRLITNPLGSLRYLLDFGYQYVGYYENLMKIARNIRQ